MIYHHFDKLWVEPGYGIRQPWALILALSFANCVILEILFNLSESQFPYRSNSNISLIRFGGD